jgi:hypothetical protein
MGAITVSGLQVVINTMTNVVVHLEYDPLPVVY